MTSTSLNGKYRHMLKRNIDIVEMALSEARNHGAEVWLSLRKNDHHNPDDKSFNSSLGYERAQELGVGGSRMLLDYTNDAVQSYYRDYVGELCQNYDIDGIELDFLRSCPIMEEATEDNIEIMNTFVRDLRKITKGIRKDIQMGVRLYPTIEKNLGFGLDAARWIGEGNIDVVTIENWYIPTLYNFPVKEWRRSIAEKNAKNHPYTLLCGTDWAVSCDDIDHVSEAAPFVMQFEGNLSKIKDDFNSFRLVADDNVTIRWIEIQTE